MAPVRPAEPRFAPFGDEIDTKLTEQDMDYLTLNLHSDNEDVVRIVDGRAELVGEGTATVWIGVTAPYYGTDT